MAQSSWVGKTYLEFWKIEAETTLNRSCQTSFSSLVEYELYFGYVTIGFITLFFIVYARNLIRSMLESLGSISTLSVHRQKEKHEHYTTHTPPQTP
jgi:hypothetical protein